MLKQGVGWLSLSRWLQNPRKSGQIPDTRPAKIFFLSDLKNFKIFKKFQNFRKISKKFKIFEKFHYTKNSKHFLYNSTPLIL